MPPTGSNLKYREPTVKCPDCGALVPPALAECFVCDRKMPTQLAIAAPAEMSARPEEDNAEELFRKLEEIAPLEEENLPGEEKAAAAPLTEEAITDLILEFERDITPEQQKVTQSVGIEKGAGVAEVRTHRGLAIASAGGLVYALGLILFLPLLGNFATAILIIPAALMIVGGSNIALNESAEAERANRFSCPLCGTKLPRTADECTNCGALFAADGQ